MRCRSAHGNGEDEVEVHQGGRSWTSHCEAEITVGVSKNESTDGWKEEKIETYV